MARPLPPVFRNERVSTHDMRLGRELLIGMGWAGTLGVVALCTLMFLFTYVAFDGAQKDGDVAKLPSVHEGQAALGRATPVRALQRPAGPRPSLQDAALRLLPPLDPPPRVRAGVATAGRSSP